MASVKVAHWVELAERSAFKGHYRRAIERYKDALFYLNRETVKEEVRNPGAERIGREIEAVAVSRLRESEKRPGARRRTASRGAPGYDFSDDALSVVVRESGRATSPRRCSFVWLASTTFYAIIATCFLLVSQSHGLWEAPTKRPGIKRELPRRSRRFEIFASQRHQDVIFGARRHRSRRPDIFERSPVRF